MPMQTPVLARYLSADYDVNPDWPDEDFRNITNELDSGVQQFAQITWK